MTKGDTGVDVHEQLARVRDTVENARSMPMSASAVVNRAELLEDIDALAAGLEQAFAEMQRLTTDRDSVVAQGHQSADQIVAQGHAERERLVSDAEVYRIAKVEADRLLAEAQQEATELRRETDEYVDSRLANFEVALGKTMEAVARGRERLHGRSDLDTWGREGVDDILLPGEEQN